MKQLWTKSGAVFIYRKINKLLIPLFNFVLQYETYPFITDWLFSFLFLRKKCQLRFK